MGRVSTAVNRRRWALDATLAFAVALAEVRYVSNGIATITDWPTPQWLGRLARGVPLGTVEAEVLAVLASLPLALRRKSPLLALWLVAAGTLLSLAVNPDVAFIACIALCVAIYSAAAYSIHRAGTLASLPAMALLLVALFQDAALPSLPHAWVGVLVLLPVGLAGAGIRARRRRDHRERTFQQQERSEALRVAVGQERARLARELHDVVTHHVSMMVILAGAARTVLAAGPEDAREAIRAVETSGRTALLELRGVLGALTAGADAELAPLPGLDAVPELVARIRGTGMPVDYHIVGEPRPVPQGVELTAYRIAQEALTNTLRHATAASATITVEYAPDHLNIEITDDGAPAEEHPSSAGYGLAGLRERVAIQGGSMDAGRRLTGGYRVHATLPFGVS
jgi:signal transduction histidine kinase